MSCAIAVVFGHVYPVWYEFRGGKGAATLIGAVSVLAPAALFLFAQVSVVGPLANAVAIPVVSAVVTPLALLAIITVFPQIALFLPRISGFG